MELGEQTLKDFLKTNSPLKVEDILSLFCQILEGIKSVHDLGYSHRDLKSRNIIFKFNRIKLIDFGLMKSVYLCSLSIYLKVFLENSSEINADLHGFFVLFIV